MGGMSWANPEFLLRVARELLTTPDVLSDGEFLKIGVNIRDGKRSYWMFVKDDPVQMIEPKSGDNDE